jgi:integrase
MVCQEKSRTLEMLPATRVGLRDRTLLLVGFAGAFRRSELVSLDVQDVEVSAAGLIVTLRRSNTDQEGASRYPLRLDRGHVPDACAASMARDGTHH